MQECPAQAVSLGTHLIPGVVWLLLAGGVLRWVSMGEKARVPVGRAQARCVWGRLLPSASSVVGVRDETRERCLLVLTTWGGGRVIPWHKRWPTASTTPEDLTFVHFPICVPPSLGVVPTVVVWFRYLFHCLPGTGSRTDGRTVLDASALRQRARAPELLTVVCERFDVIVFYFFEERKWSRSAERKPSVGGCSLLESLDSRRCRWVIGSYGS